MRSLPLLLLIPALALASRSANAQRTDFGSEEWNQCRPYRGAWWNMDFPGSDIRSLHIQIEVKRDRDKGSFLDYHEAAMNCAEACEEQEGCAAWTFIWSQEAGEAQTCYLKDAPSVPVIAYGAVSSLRREVPTAWAGAAPGGAPPAMEAGTNRPGSDYRSFEIVGNAPAVCQRACFDDHPRCKAWTVVRPGVQGPQARCWLKDAVPEAVEDPCCISGVRPNVTRDQPREGFRETIQCSSAWR